MTYFTDAVKIISCSTDKYGVLTETESNKINARIKDNNRLVMNSQGKEVVGSMTIMIDKKFAINYGDKIKVVKRWGVDYGLKDKQFIIHKIEGIGGFSQDLIRVEI